MEKQKNDILKKSAILAIASLVCFLISRISYKLMTFMYIAVILFFVVIYLGNKVNKVAKEYNEKKATNDETKQRQDNEEHAFLESLKNFEEEKLKGIQSEKRRIGGVSLRLPYHRCNTGLPDLFPVAYGR